MVTVVGGKKCTCGDILRDGVVHYTDGRPCYVIDVADLNEIVSGIAAGFDEYEEDEKQSTERACETSFIDSAGNEWTPELINKYASKAEALATYICENEKYLSKADIVKLCAAVKDNWKRYWASC